MDSLQSTRRRRRRSLADGQLNGIEEANGNGKAPLGDYAGLIVLFTVVVGGFFALKKRSLPEQIKASEILLLGLATQKVSRIITKSRVASVVRAPFTIYEGSAGAGEVEGRPRGTGFRGAMGELISCLFCLGTWIAFAGVAGLVSNPRATRALASVFAVGSISDLSSRPIAG